MSTAFRPTIHFDSSHPFDVPDPLLPTTTVKVMELDFIEPKDTGISQSTFRK
jgi:hypothetical protein